jgi:hypothetical protein
MTEMILKLYFKKNYNNVYSKDKQTQLFQCENDDYFSTKLLVFRHSQYHKI